MLAPHGGLVPVTRGEQPPVPWHWGLCGPPPLAVGLSPILELVHTPLPGQESVARLCLGRGRQFRGWVSAGGRVSQQRGGWESQ